MKKIEKQSLPNMMNFFMLEHNDFTKPLSGLYDGEKNCCSNDDIHFFK